MKLDGAHRRTSPSAFWAMYVSRLDQEAKDRARWTITLWPSGDDGERVKEGLRTVMSKRKCLYEVVGGSLL